MATSAWMKMMDRHDAERVKSHGPRSKWSWLGKRVAGQNNSRGRRVRFGIPILYRGYPGANGEPK